MSDNEGGPVLADSGSMKDEMMDSDNQSYRYGDRRGGAGRNSSNRCYNCGQVGHLSYDCRQKGGGAGGAGNGMMNFRSRNTQRCYNCQREGHISRDCNLPPGAKSCYNCGMEGHLSRDCSEPRKERAKNCFSCSQPGHIAAQCPNRSG